MPACHRYEETCHRYEENVSQVRANVSQVRGKRVIGTIACRRRRGSEGVGRFDGVVDGRHVLSSLKDDRVVYADPSNR